MSFMENIKKQLNKNVRYKKEKINYKELKDIMKKEKALLIDVRSQQEFKEGHLNKAINIPFYELTDNITKIAKEKNHCIIVYCQSGIRSSKVVEELKKMDYNNVYELDGGLDQIY